MEEVKAVELTIKTARVLEIMKDNGGELFAAEIADVDAALFDKGIRSVSPLLVNLGKKGFVANVGKGDRQVLDKDGNTVTRSYAKYQITDEGKALEYTVKAA